MVINHYDTDIIGSFGMHYQRRQVLLRNEKRWVSCTVKNVPLLETKYSVKKVSSWAGRKQSNVSIHLKAVASTQLVSAINASTTFPMCSLRLRSATARGISISPICEEYMTKFIHFHVKLNMFMILAYINTPMYLQWAPHLPSLLLLWLALFLCGSNEKEYCHCGH